MFPIDPANPKLGTWLDSKWATGGGVGCKVCCAAGFKQSGFGAYQICSSAALQICNLHAHAQSAMHKAAVEAYLHGHQDAALSVMCPGWDTFKHVANEIVAGGTLRNEHTAHRKIMWCLKEALCNEDREVLKSAVAIALFRDERKGRLAVRYRAVNQNLDEFSGTLGQERDFGTGATKITEATTRIMERMCTKFNYAPKYSCSATPTWMPDLMAHVRANVMCIAVDSAGDELLASEMMRDRALSQSQVALTPNLKFVLRDAAHASRRIISRPWNADPYLRDVALMMAQGRSSVAKLVQNSTETSRVFAGYVKSSSSSVVTSAIKNMRAASHRFESWQKPLGRTALFMHASIKTALYVASRPASDDNTDKAKEWLEWVDSERCLMLAMMADVADEGMCLTRVLDNEDVDTASLNSEVFLFSQKINALFGESKRCLTIFGYTSVMLNLLKEYVVWHINGRSRSIGFENAVPRDIVDRCIQRMRSYMVLARAALEAEFPSFEISQVTWVTLKRCRGLCCCYCFLFPIGPHAGPWGLISGVAERAP